MKICIKINHEYTIMYILLHVCELYEKKNNVMYLQVYINTHPICIGNIKLNKMQSH